MITPHAAAESSMKKVHVARMSTYEGFMFWYQFELSILKSRLGISSVDTLGIEPPILNFDKQLSKMPIIPLF